MILEFSLSKASFGQVSTGYDRIGDIRTG